MIRRYGFGGGGANGLCYFLVDRFLKTKKYTCSDPDEHKDFMRPIHAKLLRRYHLTHVYRRACRDFSVGRTLGDPGVQYWQNGKFVRYEVNDKAVLCEVDGEQIHLTEGQTERVVKMHQIFLKAHHMVCDAT